MTGRDGKPYVVRLTILTLLAFSAAVALAQPPGMPPQGNIPMMGRMPKIPATELTEKSAKNAIDAYLKLRDKYGKKIPPANKAQAMTEGAAAAAEVNAVVTGHGFDDTADWQKAITSVALAYGFNKENNAGEIDKQIAEMEANTEIPEAYKQQMIGTLKSVRPSENNLTVVKALLEDPSYGDKIRSIGD